MMILPFVLAYVIKLCKTSITPSSGVFEGCDANLTEPSALRSPVSLIFLFNPFGSLWFLQKKYCQSHPTDSNLYVFHALNLVYEQTVNS